MSRDGKQRHYGRGVCEVHDRRGVLGKGKCFRSEELLVKRKMRDYIRHTIEDAVLMHTCSSVPFNRQTGLKEGRIPSYRPLEGSIEGSENASP